MDRIVIVGGGFAGFWAAVAAVRELRAQAHAAAVTLVDAGGHLVMRPRLYEPFGPHLRVALAPLLEPLGVTVQVATVTAIDAAARTVATAQAGAIGWDRLVLAAGSVQAPLPVPGAARWALDVDTWAGAERFDAHLRAELAAPDRPGALTFVVVGAGFTGIEMACEMRRRIRHLAGTALADAARVVLLERADVVGPQLGAGPRPVVAEALVAAGVEVRTGVTVAALAEDAVQLADGTRIETLTTVVASGLRASPLAAALGAPGDADGRVRVDRHLRVPGRPGVFATGDAAHALADATHPALMSCQHALTMGRHAGANAARDLLGRELAAYAQPGYRTCLDLGDFGAVLTRGWERTVEQAGHDAKAIKAMINGTLIYPPAGDPAALLAAAAVD